ncbi:hypothetical protein [Deinococcus puniceus]|uniref:hypothetical protein n=1 Tax=Deinococcus puniceus TaxID=1182568 RepID=UPI0012FC928F|nr:hypothetical protein [Deinococcus puniceus]
MAKIINGIVYSADGGRMSMQDVTKTDLGGLNPEEISNAIDVEIISMDNMTETPEKINRSFNETEERSLNAQNLGAQASCVFDFNKNGKCDTYLDYEIIAKKDYYGNFRQFLYEGSRNVCWSATSTFCEFGMKNTYTGSVKASVTGKWVFPAKQEIGGSLDYTYTWSTELNATTRIPKGSCAQYKVTLSNTEYKGYYKAPFYEITNIWGAKSYVGTYNIPYERWRAVVPASTTARGWFAC